MLGSFILRGILAILVLGFLGCSRKKADLHGVSQCEREKREAVVDYEKGIFRFVNGEVSVRYASELKDLLDQKGIEYQVAGLHGEGGCYGVVMDSLLKVRFGADFLDKLALAADSLFFEKNKHGVFAYSDVDTWALRKNNNDHLGGEFVIHYLNGKLASGSSFRFVSNIVDRPYYVIAFTVDKDGRTTNVEIKERNSTEKFPGTEELIVSEVGKITGWVPATIRNQAVSATFQMGVAIDSGQ